MIVIFNLLVSNPLTMNHSAERAELLRQRFLSLEPTELEIIDDSHLHAGHAANREGASHFRVIIASPRFQGLNRVAQQRLVYATVQDLMPYPIHALAITTKLA